MLCKISFAFLSKIITLPFRSVNIILRDLLCTFQLAMILNPAANSLDGGLIAHSNTAIPQQPVQRLHKPFTRILLMIVKQRLNYIFEVIIGGFCTAVIC